MTGAVSPPLARPLQPAAPTHFLQLGTVGYGDVRATNLAEMLYAVAAIVLGISVFGYIAGKVSLLLGAITSGGEPFARGSAAGPGRGGLEPVVRALSW